MNDILNTLIILEDKSQKRMEAIKLPFSHNALSPYMSSGTIDNHMKLYKGYVARYNDPEANERTIAEAGAILHEIFFSQLKRTTGTQRPTGRVLDLILRHWDNVVEFKKALRVEATKFSGSGWLYLAKNGKLRNFHNHQKRNDIVLLIDLWEHAFMSDYHGDKGKYIDGLWHIIDWNIINQRV